MLRLDGLVLFRRESEGWMVSGGIGLVGGVENIGVAGESIAVGPAMTVRVDWWVLFMQVVVVDVVLSERLYLLDESDSRNGERR